MKSKKYYNCFSKPLKDFLTEERGHVFIRRGVHSETQKDFWVFILDKYLAISLQLWSERKFK